MEYILLTIFLVSFITTLVLTKLWIKIAKKENFLVKDANKHKNPLVPSSGGIAPLFGFIIGVLFYVAISIFYFKRQINLVEVFALLTMVLIISFIGFLDDITGGWKKGIKQWQKPLLMLPAALPLMAIKAGESTMAFPIIGNVNLGYIYPLILIPIGVMGASQGFNILAGLNGLSVSLGGIILLTLGFIAWQLNLSWIAIIAGAMAFALLAFYIFNKYPAKVFEGDVLRYPLGALIAGIAILANIEKAALILFIPFIIELAIKAKHKLKTECFLIPNEDNSLKAGKKIGSLTHIMFLMLSKIRKKVYEKDIVNALIIIEILLCIIAISTMVYV